MNELDETYLTRNFFSPHQHGYWEARKLAFAAISKLDQARKDVANSPSYYCTGYNEDDEPLDIIENLAPHEHQERCAVEVMHNPNAMSILKAQNRTDILRNLYQRYGPEEQYNYTCYYCEIIFSETRDKCFCPYCGEPGDIMECSG